MLIERRLYLMNNIAIKSDNGKFRFRGGGIIIQNGKVLMVHDEKRKYYYAIGGAVHIGEKASEAAVREVYEESGLIVEVEKLLLIQENFFELEDGLHHEIAFYYLMKDIGKQKIVSNRVLDNAEEGLVWLDINQLENDTVYPQIYKDILRKIPNEITHSVVDDRTK